ncbi:MAG TPA: sigma-70 family RNA polymerase sigma factor [Actinophytocola sp.]|uniref:sigma-70 family RNA polymerase sigma factor n=1 Tax=Actinophytocola sp. TaxID=1872138 RepID=UPI002E0C1215|nr:sigma-70 family RNA polymerase sigma factor [Actinophytocola sp.]
MRLPGGRRADRSASDDALVASLYEHHGKRMLADATRMTGDEHLAEDVVQEAWIRAWLHLDALLNKPGSIRGWFRTVVQRIVIDQARACAARPVEVAPGHAPDETPDDPTELVEDAVLVAQALKSLSPEHREVLVEVYYHGRTVNEVAAFLAIPPGTVKSRVFYALRSLRTVIGDE